MHNLSKKLFVLAGEISGDLHAGLAIKALKEQQPDIEVFGVGGEQLKKAGVKLLYETHQINFMGFVEVAKHFFFLKKVISTIKKTIQSEKPDAALLVDYPGMNLIIAEFLHQQNIPVIYYIAPQVWAWKEKRVQKIKTYVSRLLIVFLFEEEFFKARGVEAEFVGHPIIEELEDVSFESEQDFREKNTIMPHEKIIGVLPGSRTQELDRIYPEMLKALKLLQQTHSVKLLLGKAPNLPNERYEKFHQEYGIQPTIVSGYETMKYSDVVLVTSGTATLETLYFGTPMVVLYKTNWLNYEIGKRLVKIGKFALANIVSKGLNGEDKLVPELLQDEINAERVVKEVSGLLDNQTLYRSVQDQLLNAKTLLGEKKPSREVTKALMEVLNHRPNH